jgi:hypothetical protein
MPNALKMYTKVYVLFTFLVISFLRIQPFNSLVLMPYLTAYHVTDATTEHTRNHAAKRV